MTAQVEEVVTDADLLKLEAMRCNHNGIVFRVYVNEEVCKDLPPGSS